MQSTNFEAVYENINALEITREIEGFSARLGDHVVQLRDATNFEFRPTSPMMVEHLYLGNESGDDGYTCRVTFLRPRRVRLSNAAPRCYVHIE